MVKPVWKSIGHNLVKVNIHQETRIGMFIAALLTIRKRTII